MAFFEFLSGAVDQARRDIAILQQDTRERDLKRQDEIETALQQAKKELAEEEANDDAALAQGRTLLNNNPSAGGKKLLENMSDEQITELGYNFFLQKPKNQASYVRAVAGRAFVMDENKKFTYRDPFELPEKTDDSAVSSLEETQKSFGRKFGEAIGITPRSTNELIREETQDPKTQRSISRVLSGQKAVEKKPIPVLDAEVVKDLDNREKKELYGSLYTQVLGETYDSVMNPFDGTLKATTTAKNQMKASLAERPKEQAKLKIIQRLQSLDAFDDKSAIEAEEAVRVLAAIFDKGEIPEDIAKRIKNREISSVVQELKQGDTQPAPTPGDSSKITATPEPKAAGQITREEYEKLPAIQQKKYQPVDSTGQTSTDYELIPKRV
jgi:hypothetical protein